MKGNQNNMSELPQYPHSTWPDTIPLIARVGSPNILGMIERGSERDINPSVEAVQGIGETASRVMFRDPATSIGAQGENNSS